MASLSPPPVANPVDTAGIRVSLPWIRWFQALYSQVKSLYSGAGGNALKFPYGAFHDTTTQSAAAATITAVTFNTTDSSNGVSLGTPTSRIIVLASGLYNLQFSFQASNNSAQIDDVTVWIRLNGVDINNSAGVSGVPNKHGSTDGHSIISWNFIAPMNSGDYYEMMWTTDNGVSSLVSYPAGVSPVHPVSPAAILTMQFVSALA